MAERHDFETNGKIEGILRRRKLTNVSSSVSLYSTSIHSARFLNSTWLFGAYIKFETERKEEAPV